MVYGYLDENPKFLMPMPHSNTYFQWFIVKLGNMAEITTENIEVILLNSLKFSSLFLKDLT